MSRKQANIYIKNIEKYILNHTEEEIELYKLDDDRFSLKVDIEDINSSKKYHLYLKTIDDTHISIHKAILR